MNTLTFGLQLLDSIPETIKVYYEGFHTKPTTEFSDEEALHKAFPTESFRVKNHGDFFQVLKLYPPESVFLSNVQGLSKPIHPLSLIQLRERFRTCTVTVTPKGVRVRSLALRCHACARGMQPEERRDGICTNCYNKQHINCKFCHRSVEREHNCVRMPDQIRKNNKVYKLCTHCNKYISRNSHKRHVQRKHFSYQFKCKKCPKKFGCKSDLNLHMTVHSSVRRFDCPHCEEKFKWQSHRSKHVKEKHPNTERPQKASVCLDSEISLLTQTQLRSCKEIPQGRGQATRARARGLQDILMTLSTRV